MVNFSLNPHSVIVIRDGCMHYPIVSDDTRSITGSMISIFGPIFPCSLRNAVGDHVDDKGIDPVCYLGSTFFGV